LKYFSLFYAGRGEVRQVLTNGSSGGAAIVREFYPRNVTQCNGC